MSDSPRYLKSLASHFVLRDWQYTRLHTIKHIRYGHLVRYCCECGETEPLT